MLNPFFDLSKHPKAHSTKQKNNYSNKLMDGKIKRKTRNKTKIHVFSVLHSAKHTAHGVVNEKVFHYA